MSATENVLLADDALYDELYDVKHEAEASGNYIDIDPYPLMNALRDKAPFQKGLLRELMGLPPYQRSYGLRGLPGYTALGFEVCEAAFRNTQEFSNSSYSRPGQQEKSLGILEMDNPEHHAYRKAVQSLFLKSKALTWWREHWITEITEDLVGNLAGSDRSELNMQLCARLPVHTITRAVGLAGNDALVFRAALVRSMGNRAGPQAQLANLLTVERMLLEVITDRRAQAGDDLISWLIAAEIEVPGDSIRPLNDREIMIFARLLLLAGGGTTWRQLGIVLLALLIDRDQLEAVKADRSLIDAAVEESVRWNPTNPVFSRLAVQDFELAGITIPKGAAVEICLGAANREPARWQNPDVFDLHRPVKYHLGFGIGAHMCLGRNVAASEMNLAINKLLDHFPNIRLDPAFETPYVTGGLEQRGVSSLPVILK